MALTADLQKLQDNVHTIEAHESSLLWLICRRLPLPADPLAGLQLLSALLGDNTDFVARAFSKAEQTPSTLRRRGAITAPPAVAAPSGQPQHIVYLSSLVDARKVNLDLVAHLSTKRPLGDVAAVKPVTTVEDAALAILGGQVLLLAPASLPGVPAVAVAAARVMHRPIGRPIQQTTIKGPQAGFVEDLSVNLGQLRRYIRDPRLQITHVTLGALSHTGVALCYVQGLANQSVVNEARYRLRALALTMVPDSNYLEEMIEDAPMSLFPTVDFTPRPDTVAAALMEGRFAILVDGSPDALIAPVNFWSFIKAPDDYYQRFYASSFLRLLRLAILFLALVMPSLYIAVTTFHQQMLPGTLVLSVAKAEAGVPFPVVVESFLMELVLEILREASLHMPKKLGQSLSVVGALIIGQAAVSANLVSWPVVVVVTVTALANFAIPGWSLAQSIRILRYALMAVAGAFGLPGVLAVVGVTLAHLVSLRSFGLPYFYPVAPFDGEATGDVMIRRPHWSPSRRPRLLDTVWRRRVRPGRRPRPTREAAPG